MKKLIPSTQYKKDYKRYRNDATKLQKLFEVLRLLETGQPLPETSRLHQLIGDYAGCMECHIRGDFLLIWTDPSTEEIILVRLGSHSELFGKNAKR